MPSRPDALPCTHRAPAPPDLPLPVSAWLSQHESITLDPYPDQWRCRPGPLTPEAREFRRQLGLTTDRPVIMSGHQAELWHAGIAAKALALDAAAARFHAAAAWVIVDQDPGAPARLRHPVLRKGAGADRTPARAAIELIAPADPAVVTGRQPPGRTRPIAIHPDTPPAIAAAIARIAAALDTHLDAPSRAEQTTRAALDLLAPARAMGTPDLTPPTPTPLPTIIPALGLARTELFARLVGAMREAPHECVAHYNAAVAHHPRARLRPLLTAPRAGPELPLWRITPDGRRHAAFARDLDSGEPALAPRALTMTALLRWGACDLFIHGLGGGRYDPVMEAWLAHWLGITDMAPAVVVSATRLLPLVESPPPTPEQVARARWAAHHARHNPPANDGRKRALASAVHSARTGAERAERFRQLHDWLDRERRLRAEDLVALDARAADLAAHARLSEIVHDRTWPFALLPPESMRSLHARIRDAL